MVRARKPLTADAKWRNNAASVKYRNKPGQKKLRLSAYYAKIDARRAKINEIKSVPCADCGGLFPPVCMDFDHVRGEKVGGISTMIGQSVSMAQLLAEVAKCEVVCANCHRIRTAKRGYRRGPG